MNQRTARRNQDGFSLVELMVAITVMGIVVGAVFSLVRDSMKVASSTYELTDAQENLRTAQEIINRDLMCAGEGLKSISTIRAPATFATGFITATPVVTSAGIVNLGIITTDNNVAAGTAVPQASPAATIRTSTDRQTIMEIDPSFEAVSPTAITSTGGTVTLSATDYAAGNFVAGEIYFLTSSLGGTFGAITSVDSTNKKLNFASGDTYGLNLAGAGGHINFISTGGTLPTSLMRMKMIQYYVNSNGMLMRRVFGVPGRGFRESIVAEHVVNVQFTYYLVTVDSSGNVTPSSTASLTTSQQQLGVRHVEVKVTVETPHSLQNGSKQQMTMTTSTSVRNMQFRQAL
jgi:prepilin-type N-terminal cleavage/methylation domain-containing protein